MKILELFQHDSAQYLGKDFNAACLKATESEPHTASTFEHLEGTKPLRGRVWLSADPLTGNTQIFKHNYDTSD
jgi:hypothetical protein